MDNPQNRPSFQAPSAAFLSSSFTRPLKSIVQHIIPQASNSICPYPLQVPHATASAAHPLSPLSPLTHSLCLTAPSGCIQLPVGRYDASAPSIRFQPNIRLPSFAALCASLRLFFSISKVIHNLRRLRAFFLILSVIAISPHLIVTMLRAFFFRNPISGIATHSAFSTGTATVFPLTIPTPTASREPPQKNLVILAGILFVVSAALAAAETAITTLWPWKVRELAEREGPKSPFAALEGDLTRFLTTILVSTTSATVFSTAIATELAGHTFGPTSVPFVTAALTVIFLFFGEILPKALAVHAPAKVSRVMVPVISLLSVIVYPVGKLLAWLSTRILKLMKLPLESDATVSEEELRLIVSGADQSGSIEKYESQIIHNVLDLEDTNVSEVMCPRVDMVAIASESSLTELLEMEKQWHYSRMPVFDGTIDNIVGIVMAKALLRYLKEDTQLLLETKVSEILDPAFFVPESMSVWVALEEMRKRRLHMAIVVDEYGGTAGLITLEDILEEVVGEIYDEDDDFEAESSLVRKGSDGQVMIDGQAELEKVCEVLQMSLTEDELHDFGTISGFLCAKMGGIPNINEVLIIGRVKFTVVDADDRRIKSVRADEVEVPVIDKEGLDENAGVGNGPGADGSEGLSWIGDDADDQRESRGNGGTNADQKQMVTGDDSPLKKIINGFLDKEKDETVSRTSTNLDETKKTQQQQQQPGQNDNTTNQSIKQ